MNLIRFLSLLLFVSFGASCITSTPSVAFNSKGWDKHKSAISSAASRTDVSPLTLATFASIETTMGAHMVNKSNRNVGGLFQFTNRTWRDMLRKHGSKYGLSIRTPKSNSRANALMAAELIRDNRGYLEAKLHRKVTLPEIYMAHMLGTYGAEKLLKAKNNKLARNVIGPGGNNKFFYANGKPRTVGQFKLYMQRYVNSHSLAYKTQATAMLPKHRNLQTAMR